MDDARKGPEQSVKKVGKQFDFQHKILGERLNLLYKNLLVSIPSSLVCLVLIFFSLSHNSHTALLTPWFYAMLFILGVRMIQTRFYLHYPHFILFHYYGFVVTAFLNAVLWGMSGSILMPEGHYIDQMSVLIVLAGIVTGAGQSLQASLFICLGYIYILVIPIVFWVFSQAESEFFMVGIALSFYMFFISIVCLRGSKFVNNTLKLKYENIDLAENLLDTNDELKKTNQELIEKQDNLRLIHDNAPIGMAVVSLDGRWLNVNNKLCEILGYSKERLETLKLQDVLYKEDLELDWENKQKLLSGMLPSFRIEKRYVTKDREVIWVDYNVSLVRDKNGTPLYYISQIQDINDKKQNELIISELANMNAMLQLCHNSKEAYPIISHSAKRMFPHFAGGLSITNPLTDEQEVVARWDRSLELKPYFKSEDCWAFRSGKMYVVNDPQRDSLCNHFDKSPMGGYLCMPMIIQNEMIGLLNFIAPAHHSIKHTEQDVINNFSEIVKLSLSNIHLNETLSEQVIRDPLTGLFNRRYLSEYLPQMLQHTLHAKHSLCVCMLDLDYFKLINDEHGHEAGDIVLKFIGSLLNNNIRESDIVCRYGGEEFVIVLIGTDMGHAKTQMERIREEVKKSSINVKTALIKSITISIGIAEAPRHGETADEILRVADLALYKAKETGRDRVIASELVKGSDK